MSGGGGALAETMRISAAGRLGIGTATPDALLQLESAADGAAKLEVRCTVTPNGSINGARLGLGLHQANDSGSGANETLAGDLLGEVMFKGQGYDYTYQGGRIACGVQTGATNNTRTQQGTYLSFSTMDTAGDSYEERVRIDQDGNVGIGTTAPGAVLEVDGTTGEGITIDMNSGATHLNFATGGTIEQSIFLGGENLYFYDDSALIMFLEKGGNVGIGTTAPQSAFHVRDASTHGNIHAGGSSTILGSLFNYQSVASGYTNICNLNNSGGTASRINLGFGPISSNQPTNTVMRISQGGDVAINNQAAASGQLLFFSTHPSYYNFFIGTSAANKISIGSAGTDASPEDNTLTDLIAISPSVVNVVGTFTAGTKTFQIPHPLPELKDTHHLIHGCLEGPRLDLIYRGTINLVDGAATVDLDDAAGMTAGTWVLLCRDAQVFTTNETGWSPVRGTVGGSTLTIECEEDTCTDTISWMVVAERQDQHILDTDWTDEDGRPILEPLQVEDPTPSASPSE
jgi:hypothetical protein